MWRSRFRVHGAEFGFRGESTQLKLSVGKRAGTDVHARVNTKLIVYLNCSYLPFRRP